jgi:anti-sigma B factor antagonist
MSRPLLHILETQVGDVTVLHMQGQIVLDDGDLVFRDAVNALIEGGRLKIVVDLADVTYIDSAGIGVMIARYLGVRRHGGDMRLANLTARSHRVMTITHLMTVFEPFESVDAAVRSFQDGSDSARLDGRQ